MATKNEAVNAIRQIKENYNKMGEGIAAELNFSIGRLHNPSIGTFREKVWLKLFEQIIPKKHCIAQGAFVIDSKWNITREIDLVIYDEQYTPYVLKKENLVFVPYEAVVAVVQCKSDWSDEWKDKEGKVKRKSDEANLQEWLKSMDRLKMDYTGFSGGVQGIVANKEREVRPLRILCSKYSFEKVKEIGAWKEEEDKLHFDIILGSGAQKEDQLSIWYDEKQTYDQVFDDIIKNVSLDDKDKVGDSFIEKRNQTIKEYIEVKDNTLLTFLFLVNRYISFINNTVLFPHEAYVKMFNDVEKEAEKQ